MANLFAEASFAVIGSSEVRSIEKKPDEPRMAAAAAAEARAADREKKGIK